MTTSLERDPAGSLRSTHHASGHSVDFGRNLCLVLGLPFDVIDLETAVCRVRSAVALRTRLFISTPNTNFVVAAMRDEAFRDSVFHSDLSLMDGMPLVWVARLMGIAIPQRVSGSDLFEALRREGAPPISVYFFGGKPGAAATAASKVNAARGAMRCVGFDEAGFGTVEQMSDQATIERINATGADFLVVSLGAAKGQAWIEHNLSRLTPPVVSHLGAVVNFVAGSVNRAPIWVRNSGLEWLWRVKEEPHLWKRYAVDALAFARLGATFVLPQIARRQLFKARNGNQVEADAIVIESNTESLIELGGTLCGTEEIKLRELCVSFASQPHALLLDFNRVTSIDNKWSAVLAMLFSHRARCGLAVGARAISTPVGRALGYFGVAWMIGTKIS
jgi:N-acetylglucosaminyldiphosphoundecaprenol N-acetyl-beta-D-mannosaminyltransferase